MRPALLAKLPVGARTKHVYHRPNCPLCSTLETTRHVLSCCAFLRFAFDVVTKAFVLAWSPQGAKLDLQQMFVDSPELLQRRSRR